jgi:Fe-S cluster biogenesis protein NfuA
MTRETQSFEERIGRIEDLVQRIEQWSDDRVREAARSMVRDLLELHAAGLAKLLRLLSASAGGGRDVLDACLQDDLVRSLLLLHDLHPDGLEVRVRQALDGVRPYLNGHGGDVELVDVAGGTVRLRMRGSCQGCPSSMATLKYTIEEAIYAAAPDVAAIEVDGLPDGGAAPGELVQLEIGPQGATASGY